MIDWLPSPIIILATATALAGIVLLRVNRELHRLWEEQMAIKARLDRAGIKDDFGKDATAKR